MADFSDYVSEGIMAGFAGISPFLEKQQKMAMLREDRDYARLLSEEQRGYAKRAEQRDIEQFNAQMKRDAELLPLEKGQILAQTEASQASTEASKAQTEGTRVRTMGDEMALAEQTKYLALRADLVKQMRGMIGDDKDLNLKLSSFAANPSLSTNEIHGLLEGEVRKKAAPFVIKTVKDGLISGLDPNFATILEAKYIENGRLDMSDIGKYLSNDNMTKKAFMMELLAEASKIKMSMNPEDPYLGAAEAFELLTAFMGGTEALKNNNPSLIPEWNNVDSGPASPADGKASEKARKPLPEDAALMSPGEAVKQDVDKGIIFQQWGKDRIEQYVALKKLPPQALSIAVDQQEPFQIITGDALSGQPMGAFSGALAALAPGVGEGDTEDRIATLLTSESGGFRGDDPVKAAKLASELADLVQQPNEKHSQRAILDKMSELYWKLRQNGGVGASGKEEAMVKAFKEWLAGDWAPLKSAVKTAKESAFLINPRP